MPKKNPDIAPEQTPTPIPFFGTTKALLGKMQSDFDLQVTRALTLEAQDRGIDPQHYSVDLQNLAWVPNAPPE